MPDHQPKKIVIIGGGSGIYPVTRALRHLPVEVSAVVAVSDNGGSSGRIRDEFGFQPVGDLRQSLAALAEDRGEEWIRKLLLYRFEKGTGLKGHNLGNLILTALQDMTGSTSQALHQAKQIFRLQGEVIPTTHQKVDLKIVFQDGTSIVGEDYLDQDIQNPKRIDYITLTPEADANPSAIHAIEMADHIIIGPGDLYASIMAALAPKGIKSAFRESQAKCTYLMNLMTRITQTNGMTAADHVEVVEKRIGKQLSHIIINNESIPPAILQKYAESHEYPVLNDLQEDTRVIFVPILNTTSFSQSTSDTAHRSLLRHDSKKLVPVLQTILT